MKLSFTLEPHGWLDINIEDEKEHYNIPASFLSDAIHYFLEDVAKLMEGATETITVIQTEPGESRIRIRRTGSTCTFEVLRFHENFCEDTIGIDEGICEFKTKLNLLDLAREVWIQINELRDLGKEEYLRRWDYDFPDDGYERFKAAFESLK